MVVTPIRRRADRLPWYGVAVVVVALVVTSAVVLGGASAGPRPVFLGGAPPAPEPHAPIDDGHLHLAGSGSDIPLVRVLATAYRDSGSMRPVVHASIGSGGGIRALLDGAIHVALVSRPLRPEEEAAGLVYEPFARVPVIVGAHLDVPEDALTQEQVLAIYRGDQTQWSDGTPIFVLQREPGDSSHRVVADQLEGFSEANEVAYRAQAYRVLYHDSTMQTALANTTGAIGLHGNGMVPSLIGFKALAIDGVPPTAEHLEDRSYPLSKTLAFVTRPGAPPEVAAFLEFVHSDAGLAAIRAAEAVAYVGRGP